LPVLGESNSQAVAASTVKLLLIADTKAGKTDWAMRAAEAGFNVLFIDGDVAIQTILDKKRGLSKEALKRLFYLPVHDYVDAKGEYVPFFAKFFVDFTTQGVFTWNDTQGRVFDRKTYAQEFSETQHQDEVPAVVGGDVIWQIRPSLIGPDTVIIMDSYTNMIHSLQQWKAADLGVDILEIEKMERDMYTGTAHKATQFLHLLRTLRSHVIVIAHPREYRKMSVPKGSSGAVAERDMKVEWTRMVPMSTSNPHALTVGKNFSDIGWIDVTGAGTRYIDFRPNDNRIVGGHTQERHNADEFQFKHLVESVGGVIPTPTEGDPAWLTRYGPGEFVPAGNRAAAALAGSSPATAKKVGGLAGLMNKNK
jgi:hypothetical protein